MLISASPIATLDVVHRLEERVTPLVSDLGSFREENEVLRSNSRAQSKRSTVDGNEQIKLDDNGTQRLTITRDELIHKKQRRGPEQNTEITTKDHRAT